MDHTARDNKMLVLLAAALRGEAIPDDEDDPTLKPFVERLLAFFWEHQGDIARQRRRGHGPEGDDRGGGGGGQAIAGGG